jgi:HK97 family phage portal protein
MSLLARATARATKGLDQQYMTQPGAMAGTVYIPIENRSTFTDQQPFGNDSALMIATFWDCVRVLAEGVASLPLLLYRRLPGGGKDRATDHEMYPVLHDAPNPSMTSFVWRELMMSHLAVWGNAYNEKAYSPSGRLQLWPIRPDRIEPRWGRDGEKLYDYLSPLGTRSTLRPGSVFHIPGLSPTGLKGYSPVELHRKTLRTHNAARDFGESTFRNNARPALVLSHPKTLSEGAITRLAGQMDELRGSGNAGKTVIMEEGLTMDQVGIPPKDAQYIETRVHEAREIQKMFRMQPHKVGDLERATFSNIEEQNLEHVTDTLRPWMVRIEQEIKLQLLYDEPDIFAEHLVDGLLRGSAKNRAEALSIRWQHANLNGDEWREIENENPLPDGLGQRYYAPVNYAPVDAAPAPDTTAVGETNQPPQLRVIKSAAVRCVKCAKLLAELAAPPYRFTCRSCKTVTTADGVVEAEEPSDGLKAMSDRLDALENRPPLELRPEIHVDARQEPPVVNFSAPPQEPAIVTVNVPKQEAPVINVRIPKQSSVVKDVERDKQGRISRVREMTSGE